MIVGRWFLQAGQPLAKAVGLVAGAALGCAWLPSLPMAVAAPKEVAVKSVIGMPPIVLPQIRIDQVDLTAWPKVRMLATVVDGRGAPVELKGILKLDVLDGSKKATVASKNNPALVSFEKGVALNNRKDAKLMPRAEAKIGLGAVMVVQGYGSTVEPIAQQRIREGAAALFKGLGKGDRGNLVWYNDRVKFVTGLKNNNTRLSDAEAPELQKKCSEARTEAKSGGPITLGPPATKDAPAPPPGTHLCGLHADLSAAADMAKNEAFTGQFPRLFNLGPPFWDIARYCSPPGGALEGFGTFAKADYEKAKAEREEALLKGAASDFNTSALDMALRLLVDDGKPTEQLALILLSDGRDGWVWDLPTCAEHPPKPCDVFDPASPINADRINNLKSDGAKAAERYKLALDSKRCVEKNQLLTARLAKGQQLFHEKAQQWIGLARAAGIRIFAVGLRRAGVLTNPYDLERLRLLAEKTGGTYREVGDGQSPVVMVKRTMAEVTGQIAVEFTHQDPDAVADAGGNLALRLSVSLDPKLESADNPGTQLASDPVTAALPKAVPILTQLKDVAWSLLVRIQELMGYEVYVIFGYVLTVAAMLLTMLIIYKLVRKIFKTKPKPA